MHSKDFVESDTVAAGAVAHVARKLRGMEFPTDKRRAMEAAQRNGADDAVLDTLAYLPEKRQYANPVELFDAIGDEVRRLETS